MSILRERTVEAYLKKRVELSGGTIRKAQWIGRAGCPDRWCGWPQHKRTAWVELKRPDGGVLSPHQTREMQRLIDCGERVELLSSFEEVDAFIEDITRRPRVGMLACPYCTEDHEVYGDGNNHPHYIRWLKEQMRSW